jgi:hypothetical protein
MTAKPVLIREDPPATTRAVHRWVRILEPLTKPERAGEWFLILKTDQPHKANIAASALSRRKYRIPPGKWEFTSRKSDGEGRVYARYLGNEDA